MSIWGLYGYKGTTLQNEVEKMYTQSVLDWPIETSQSLFCDIYHSRGGNVTLAFSDFLMWYLADLIITSDLTLLVNNSKGMLKLIRIQQHTSKNDWSLPRNIN
jgi:hypothetical protein